MEIFIVRFPYKPEIFGKVCILWRGGNGYSEKDVNAYKYGEENEANTMNL